MTFGSVGTSLVLVSFFSVQFDEKRLKKLKRDSCFPFEGSVAAEGSVDLRTTQSDDDDDDDDDAMSGEEEKKEEEVRIFLCAHRRTRGREEERNRD